MAGRMASSSYGASTTTSFERPATRKSSRRAHSPATLQPPQESTMSSGGHSPRAKKRSMETFDDKSNKGQTKATSTPPVKSSSKTVEMVHSHFTRRSTSPEKIGTIKSSVSDPVKVVPVQAARKFFSKSRNEERPKPQFNVNNIFNKKSTWGKGSSSGSGTTMATYSITTNKTKPITTSRTNSPCNVMTVQSSNVSKVVTKKNDDDNNPKMKKSSQVVIKLSAKSLSCPRTVPDGEDVDSEESKKTIASKRSTRSSESKPTLKIIVKKPVQVPTPEPSPPEEISAIDLPTPSPPTPLEEPTPDSSTSSTPEPLPQPPKPSEFKPIEKAPTSPVKEDVPCPPIAPQVVVPTVKPLPPKKKFFTTKSRNADGIKSKPTFTAKNMFGFDDPDCDNLTTAMTSASSSQQDGQGKSGQTNTTTSSQGDDDEWVTLHRVKRPNQCHELGETQSFDQDIDYCLNGLEKDNPIRIRCLSIEQLTNQCMGAEFRMHLRAHDDMPKIISALSDAPNHPDLAFCTSLLMFIYNQDRLTMDIDPKHLKLMLDLLEVREGDDVDGQVDKKHTIKAKKLVEVMKSRGYGKFLDPNNLNCGKLALEALLGLTSKRAGEWFKEELRKLKGLDLLMDTIIRIVNSPANQRNVGTIGVTLESELNKIDRSLRVLEASTYMNEINQLYLINYQEGGLINSCTTLLNSCKESIVLHSNNKMYLTTLLSILRVFTNITSESIKGSKLMGTKFDHLFRLFLDTLFEVPSFVCPDSRFDLMVLLLCLCINLVEFCPSFRTSLLQDSRKLQRLVDILMKRIEEAKETEAQADEILESAEKDSKTNDIVNIDTLLNQVVAKSGKHMEHSIIAACVSLLLGCTIQSDPKNGKELISKMLPNNSFDPLIDVLRKLHEFAHLADIMTPSGVKRVERILKVFKSSDPIVTANDSIIDLDDPNDQQRYRSSSPSLMSINDTFLNETIDDTSFERSKPDFYTY